MTGLGKIDVPDTSAHNCGNPAEPPTWKGPWIPLTKPSAIA